MFGAKAPLERICFHDLKVVVIEHKVVAFEHPIYSLLASNRGKDYS